MNFTGRWIGETQGCESEEHRWVIVQQGSTLTVLMRWDSEIGWGAYPGKVALGNQTFVVSTGRGDYQAAPQDNETFVVSRWVADRHDVVFRRQDAGVVRLIAGVVLRALNAFAFRRWRDARRVEQNAPHGRGPVARAGERKRSEDKEESL